MITIERIPVEGLTQFLADEFGAEVPAQFVPNYLKTIQARLLSEPQFYRSFGGAWWALKALLIEHQVLDFGDNVDAYWAQQFTYDTTELTCAAIFLEQEENIEQGRHQAPSFSYSTPQGNDITLALEDEMMEKLIFLRQMPST